MGRERKEIDREGRRKDKRRVPSDDDDKETRDKNEKGKIVMADSEEDSESDSESETESETERRRRKKKEKKREDRHSKKRRKEDDEEEKEKDEDIEEDSDDVVKIQKKKGREGEGRKAERKERKSKRSKSEDDGGEGDDPSESDSDVGSGSEEEDSEEERRRRKKKKKRKEERRREEDKERRRKERKRKDKEEKKREEKKKAKKKEKKEKKGPVTEYGKYGLLRETDMWNRRPEFGAWLSEIKKVNLETLSGIEEKLYFKDFMEDFNTATLPHKKFYNMDAYSKRQMMAAYMRGAQEVPGEMVEFNDEQKRNDELRIYRSQQKEAEVVRLKEAMQGGRARDMIEQARLKEEMNYLFRLGNFEEASKIQKRLDPELALYPSTL